MMRSAGSIRVAIIGAGPAGLAAGWWLARRGVSVTIYEAAGRVGGLAGSVELFGHNFDLGSHIFHTTDERVRAAWEQPVEDGWRDVTVRRGILCRYGVVDYPLRPARLGAAMGVFAAMRCGAGFALAQILPKSAVSARDIIVGRYGGPLFEAFFRGYGEKFLGQPNDRVDAAFARDLVGAEAPQWRRKIFNWLAGLRRRKKAHSVAPGSVTGETFRWPVRGSGEVWRSLAQAIEAMGGTISLTTPVSRIHTAGGRVSAVETAHGIAPCDHVISSLPLPQLRRALGISGSQTGTPALRMRSTVIVYLSVRLTPEMTHSWLYVYSERFRVGRITNFKMWTEQDDTPQVLSLEYWCNEGDDLWASDDRDLIALATRELAECGICREAKVVDGAVFRLPRTHPAFDLGHAEAVRAARSELANFAGLHSIGRHGRFSLDTTSGSMATGIDTAEAILAEAPAAPATTALS